MPPNRDRVFTLIGHVQVLISIADHVGRPYEVFTQDVQVIVVPVRATYLAAGPIRAIQHEQPVVLTDHDVYRVSRNAAHSECGVKRETRTQQRVRVMPITVRAV